MDSDGNSKDDVKVPDSDLGKEIEEAFEAGKDLMVTIVAAMGGCSFFFQRLKPPSLLLLSRSNCQFTIAPNSRPDSR